MRPPPTPTLFPYTTLFRSDDGTGGRRPGLLPAGAFLVRGLRAGLAIDQHPARTRDLHVHQDRKSTRLNSSHVAISYAVFCLKKKTKKPSSRMLTPDYLRLA